MSTNEAEAELVKAGLTSAALFAILFYALIGISPYSKKSNRKILREG